MQRSDVGTLCRDDRVTENKKYRFLSTECETLADTLKGVCGSWSQLSMRGSSLFEYSDEAGETISRCAAKHC